MHINAIKSFLESNGWQKVNSDEYKSNFSRFIFKESEGAVEVRGRTPAAQGSSRYLSFLCDVESIESVGIEDVEVSLGYDSMMIDVIIVRFRSGDCWRTKK